MRVFFDECVPRPLRRLLEQHDVQTAQQLGWGRLNNGTLIQQAESAGFEVFVTSDQNLKYQQNLQTRQIALLILSTNYWPALERHSGLVTTAISKIQRGQYLELTVPIS